MSEISSGLVAFCYMSDRYEVALFSEPPTDPLYDDMFPVVRLSDADALISAKDAEIERLERESSACDLLEEQKGTITALNMALGGEDSTSTENLIDAYEVDYNEEGLISLCRKLIAENARINDTIEALGFANREIERLTKSENDWIACHARTFRELQDSKTSVVNQAERIATKDAEILEQCRLNGMGAEREAALLGKVERQSAALKLARDALESCDVGDCSTSYVVMPSFDAVAVDEALAAINEVLKGE